MWLRTHIRRMAVRGMDSSAVTGTVGSIWSSLTPASAVRAASMFASNEGFVPEVTVVVVASVLTTSFVGPELAWKNAAVNVTACANCARAGEHANPSKASPRMAFD